MQITKVENNINPNFQRLYMPSRTTLRKYGKEFAANAEKQRSQLAELATNYDIYVVPRMKGQDTELIKSISKAMSYSDEQFSKFLPQDNYFNVHVAPYYPREVKKILVRGSYGEEILSALAVKDTSLVMSVRKILGDKDAVKYLNEMNKYYRTMS